MRYVFIVNPHAGGKKGFEMLSHKVENYFKDSHDTHMVYETKYPKHATEIVQEELLRGEFIRFYGVGGDGTLLEIIRSAANNPNCEVGIFPVGSGNDYIRTYGQRADFLHFNNQIKGEAIEVDLIKTMGGYAANICSVGLDAKVAYGMDKFKGLPGVGGSLAYDLSLAKCLLSKIGENLTIKIKTPHGDEEFKGNFIFALGACGQWYGGGYHGAPLALTNDGLLDFIIIKNPPLLKLPPLVKLYKEGRHIGHPLFSELLVHCRGTEIEIKGEKEIVCNRDGECDKVREEKFTVEPKALKFILPFGLKYNCTKMETEHLILRSWEEKDVEDYFEFASDTLVMPPAGARLIKTLEEAKIDMDEFSRDNNKFAIVLKETGKVIGSIKYQKDIRRFKVNSRSIGYEMNKSYWGRGYMTEALNAMVKNAFEDIGVDIIGIGHFFGNERSKRVIEKCGFTYEGRIRSAFKRYDGAVLDDMTYSMTKNEYFARTGKKII